MGIIRRLHSCVHLRPPYRSFKCVGASLWRSYLTQIPLGHCPLPSQLMHTRQTPPETLQTSEELPDDLKNKLFSMPAAPKIPRQSTAYAEKYMMERRLERRNTFQLLTSAVDFYTKTRTPRRTRTLHKIYSLLGVQYIDGTGLNEEDGVVDASIDSIVGNVYKSSLEIQLRDVWTMSHPDMNRLVNIFEAAGWRLSEDYQDYLAFVPQDGHVQMHTPPNDRTPRPFKEGPFLPFRLNISGREPVGRERLVPSRQGFILLYIWLRSYGFEVSTFGLISFWHQPSLGLACNNFVEEFYRGVKALLTYSHFDSMLYNPTGRNGLPLRDMKRLTSQLKAVFEREKGHFTRFVEFESISALIFGPHIHPDILDISPDMPQQIMSNSRVEDDVELSGTEVRAREDKVKRESWKEKARRRTDKRRDSEAGRFRREYTTPSAVEAEAEMLDPPPPVQVQITPEPLEAVQNEDKTLSSSISEPGVNVQEATRLPDTLITATEVAHARECQKLMKDMRKLSASVKKTINSLSEHSADTEASEHLRQRQEKAKEEASALKSLSRNVRAALEIVGEGLPSITEELDTAIVSSEPPEPDASQLQKSVPSEAEILERTRQEDRARREWADLLKGVGSLTQLLLKMRVILTASLSRGGFTSTTPGFANSLAAASIQEHKARLAALVDDGTRVVSQLRDDFATVESDRAKAYKEGRRNLEKTQQAASKKQKALSTHLKLKQLHQQAEKLEVRKNALVKELEALRAAARQNVTGASAAAAGSAESPRESSVDESSAETDPRAYQGSTDADDGHYLFADDDDFTSIPVPNEATQPDYEATQNDFELRDEFDLDELLAAPPEQPSDELIPVQFEGSRPMSAKAHRTYCRVQRSINKAFGSHFFVKAFGSSLYGVTGENSDLDLVLVDPHNPTMKKALKSVKSTGLYNLKTVAHILRKDFNVLEVVDGAKVPIIKFVDSATGVQVDLNINDRLGLKNSELLLEYCELSPFLRPLLFAIKAWARPRGLSNPSGAFAFKQKGKGKMKEQRKRHIEDVYERLSHLPEHTREFVAKSQPTPGSYAYALMTVAFLQHHYLLPNLQAHLPELDTSKEGLKKEKGVVYTKSKMLCDVRFWARKSPKGAWYQEWEDRRKDVGDLEVDEVLRAWFRYFGFEHDYTSTVELDPKDGGILVPPNSYLSRTAFLAYEDVSSTPESDGLSSYLSPGVTLDSFPLSSAPTDISAWRSADQFWTALPVERWREYAARRWAKYDQATYVGLYVRDPFDRRNMVTHSTRVPALLQFQRECQLMYAKLLGRPESLDELDVGKRQDWPKEWTEPPEVEEPEVFLRKVGGEEADDLEGTCEEQGISDDIEDTQDLESEVERKKEAQGDQVLEGEARSAPLDEENVPADLEDVDGR